MFRRLRQLALTLAALVSVVMLPIVAAAWVVSHFRSHGLMCRVGTHAVSIFSVKGKIGITVGWGVFYGTAPGDALIVASGSSLQVMGVPPDDGLDRFCHWRYVGFGFGNAVATMIHVKPAPWATVQGDILVAPIWSIALLCIPAPLLWWRRRRQLLRHSVEFCPVCNYDLRGTPGRCPECGWTQAGLPGVKSDHGPNEPRA